MADDVEQFQIRVHIIEARELKGRDMSGSGDPVCIVQALDQKKSTKTFKQTTTCTFDHIMFFEYKIPKMSFFQGKIKVTVMDANTFRRNELIGFYDFDVEMVYKSPGHELYRKWIALADKKGMNTGFMKVSITVLTEHDQAVSHKEEEELDDASDKGTDLQSMVMLPPSISVKMYAVEVSVYKADHLPKMDTIGTCDGYVVVNFGSSEQKSSVIKNTYTPVWMEKLVVQASTPTMSDLISIQLRDWDGVGKDDIIGTIFVRFSEIVEKKTIDWSVPRWVNVYGAPEVLTKKDLALKINTGKLDGVIFRGRFLMSAVAHQVPDVANYLGVKKLSGADVTEPAASKYTLRFSLYEVCQVDAKDVKVEVSVGWTKVTSPESKVKSGNAHWFTTLEDIELTLPKDLAQAPDLFISLYKSSDRLSYVQLKIADLKSTPEPSWFMLKADPFTGNPDKHPGFILFSAQFGTTAQLGPKAAIKAPVIKKFQLRAHIYQGRNLPVADDNGLSDPYVVVVVGTTSVKSNVIKETCFPLWYQTLVSEVELPDYEYASNIYCLVYDRDEITKDDFLGMFSVPRNEVNENMATTPKWYSLYRTNPKFTEGEILASFQLIPFEKASQFPEVKIIPKMKDCSLQINLVGLREVLPFLIPTQNAFVEFISSDGKKVSSKTSCKPSNTDPNFLEKLILPVMVPEDPLYAPSLNIRVRDDRKIHKPLLGNRSLSLGPFIPWTSAKPPSEADTELKVVKEIPGAPKEEPKQEEELKEIKIDIPEPDLPTDENAPLLGPQGQKINLRDLRNQMIRLTKQKTAPPVAESVPHGVEDVPEEVDKRKTVEHELELEFKDSTFATYKYYRAKKAHGIEGISIPIEVGKIKCQFRIVENAKSAPDTVDLPALFKETTYVVRIYILEGLSIVPTDADGSSNPYICISCHGHYLVKDIKKDVQSTSRPMFYKCYTLNISFPTQSIISVELWDYDKFSADDLIGSTKIDLEARLTNPEWKSLAIKPIEHRTLWNPASNNPQGVLKMWIDILTPEEAARIPEEKITPPLPRNYELRVIIWQARNVAFKDSNKMSDIFITAYPEGQHPQVTDTHWRSENGKGSFNWRMKFPIQLPAHIPTFKLQVWDKDILTPNDAICEANLNLGSFFRKVYKNQSARDEIARQWVAMSHSSSPGKMMGEVELSIELLSTEEASKYPNGFGRSDPNQHPVLPPPDRPDTSFNPFRIDKYISKVFWAKYKWRVYALVAYCICCVIIVLILILRFTFPFLF